MCRITFRALGGQVGSVAGLSGRTMRAAVLRGVGTSGHRRDGIMTDRPIARRRKKTRVVAHSQQLVRFGLERHDAIGARTRRAPTGRYVAACIGSAEALVISDIASRGGSPQFNRPTSSKLAPPPCWNAGYHVDLRWPISGRYKSSHAPHPMQRSSSTTGFMVDLPAGLLTRHSKGPQVKAYPPCPASNC